MRKGRQAHGTRPGAKKSSLHPTVSLGTETDSIQTNQQQAAMRLLSYNIHKGIGGRDRRYDLQRIIDVIHSQQPDFVCLQEVDRHVKRSRFDNQPAILAEALGFTDPFYQLNVKLKNGGYGNLILSRWPIIERHHLSLRLWLKKPRGAQLATIDTPAGPLHLVNWHLGLAEFERAWQARKLLSHHLFQQQAHLPTLIVGDTNDWRNQLKNGAFAEHQFQPITQPPSKFRTFPAVLPLGSLDKAFGRGLDIHEARPIRTPLTHAASDHLPLVIDFNLRPAHRA